VLIAAHAHALASDPVRATLSDALRIAIGVVWFVAGVQKLRSPAATRDSVAGLIDGSAGLARALARALPSAEILLGLALVIGWRGRAAALLSACAFLGLAVLLGRAAIRDSLPDGGCGCFGAGPAREIDDAGPRAVARNLVLATLAVGAAA
jgi:putative oxidoreductase